MIPLENTLQPDFDNSYSEQQRVEKARKAYEQMAGEPFSPEARQSEVGTKYWQNIQQLLTDHNLPIPDVENLKLLDLGGGSDAKKGSIVSISTPTISRNIPLTVYKPFFSRYMAALGVPTVVNIDVGPKDEQIDDIIHHFQTFLSLDPTYSLPRELNEKSLPNSFNLIFSSMLVDNLAPELRLVDISANTLKEKIMAWAKDLLEEGGYLILDSGFEGYVLRNGELVSFTSL